MARGADKVARDRVTALLAELAEAKLREAEAFAHARGGTVGPREQAATVEDARMGKRIVLAGAASAHRRARDVEIIRVELAVALKELGVIYPPQDG